MAGVRPIAPTMRIGKPGKSALRPKRCLLVGNRKLRNMVASKLVMDWSPEQISGWLKTQYPDDESMRVFHETIYRSLFIQARGVLKQELMEHLRSKRRMRRSLHATVSGQSRGQIVDAVSIRERPAEVEDRAVPGHWEGDLLSGAKNSYIATLVERHSLRSLLPAYLPCVDEAQVSFMYQRGGLNRVLGTLPAHTAACDLPQLGISGVDDSR
jgi:IS30 family transposase